MSNMITLPNAKKVKPVKSHSNECDYMGPGQLFYFDNQSDYLKSWDYIKENNIVTGTYDNCYLYIGIPNNQVG